MKERSKEQTWGTGCPSIFLWLFLIEWRAKELGGVCQPSNHLINKRHWLFAIQSSMIGLWWDHDLIIWRGFRNGSTMIKICFKVWLVSPFEVEPGDTTLLSATQDEQMWVQPLWLKVYRYLTYSPTWVMIIRPRKEHETWSSVVMLYVLWGWGGPMSFRDKSQAGWLRHYKGTRVCTTP